MNVRSGSGRNVALEDRFSGARNLDKRFAEAMNRIMGRKLPPKAEKVFGNEPGAITMAPKKGKRGESGPLRKKLIEPSGSKGSGPKGPIDRAGLDDTDAQMLHEQ